MKGRLTDAMPMRNGSIAVAAIVLAAVILSPAGMPQTSSGRHRAAVVRSGELVAIIQAMPAATVPINTRVELQGIAALITGGTSSIDTVAIEHQWSWVRRPGSGSESLPVISTADGMTTATFTPS